MIQTLFLDVERAAATGTPDQRAEMLRRIASLFMAHALRFGEAEIEPLDAILLHLARTVGNADRASLAEGLADIANAPRRIVRDLAFDPAIVVARPILIRSYRLSEDDLAQIARDAGPQHLDAVSRRRSLSERITDILVPRAAAPAVRRIAGNEGAHLSEAGFAAMLTRARDDAVLRAVLDLRHAVPESHRAGGRAAQGVIDLDEKSVVALVAQGRVDDALVAIATLAGIPADAARDAYRGRTLDPLLFLLRGVDFGWGTLKHLILARPGRRLPPEEMRGVFEAFQALSVATARKSIRFEATRVQARVA